MSCFRLSRLTKTGGGEEARKRARLVCARIIPKLWATLSDLSVQAHNLLASEPPHNLLPLTSICISNSSPGSRHLYTVI
jgi:hypothetical protein